MTAGPERLKKPLSGEKRGKVGAKEVLSLIN
jgi:hypothetical protein